MKHDLAITLWCPMVRCSELNEPAANCGPSNMHRNPNWARCIGSECAMWIVTQDGPTPSDDAGHCGLSR